MVRIGVVTVTTGGRDPPAVGQDDRQAAVAIPAAAVVAPARRWACHAVSEHRGLISAE